MLWRKVKKGSLDNMHSYIFFLNCITNKGKVFYPQGTFPGWLLTNGENNNL